MTRIDDLQKKYPTIPRDVIVKWEIKSRGVRDTDDLDKVSEWRAASGSYQNKMDEVTLRERVEKRPWRAQDGRMLRPRSFLMKSGVGANLRLSLSSPYEVREIGDGKFAIFEGEEKVDADIYFPSTTRSAPPPGEAEPLTSRGTPVSRLLSAPTGSPCFFIMPVHYCEYFSTGEQCKFCNLNPSQEDARSIGVDRPVTDSLDDALEAYRIRVSQTRIVEGRFEMGGFTKAENEERIHLSFVEKIASATPYKPNLTIPTEAMSKKGMQRLKDAGLDAMMIQLEVWDPKLFAEVLPGKAKHTPYEGWIEALLNAVDVFGVGNVTCKTLGGLTLMPPNGHKTWQEARDTHVEHVRWMIKHGILPGIDQLGLPPTTVYGADKSNLAKLPPAEYFLDIALAHHEAMTEHDRYPKINKFMYCGLNGGSGLYYGEIGILERGGGDWGSWMADVVPEEVNWMRRFIESVKSSAVPVAEADADCGC